mgnify:CR=1 FL=1
MNGAKRLNGLNCLTQGWALREPEDNQCSRMGFFGRRFE